MILKRTVVRMSFRSATYLVPAGAMTFSLSRDYLGVNLYLKGHSSAELHIYFLVHLESIYYEIFFYSKIVPNCAVAK